MSSSMYVALMNMGIKKLSNNDLCLIGLRAKATKNKCNYDSDRFHRINRFRRNKLSVSIEGIVVYDSGFGIHIIRDRKLLIPGSIRRIPQAKRLKVQGTFENAHVPKYFAMHKLLGLCIYDPESKANIISKTQAWASGWLWYTDNEKKLVHMTHPDYPNYKYTFEVGKENIMVGMDQVSFDTFDPTNTVIPTSLLSNFISTAAINKDLPRKLTNNDFKIDNDELEAMAFASLAGPQGRHRRSSS